MPGTFIRVAVVGVTIAVAALAGAGSPASGDVGAACGSSTQATVSAVDARVANDIYGGELGGTEVKRDIAHIAASAALIAALARDDRAATLKAVKRIVFHHFWHIVRLRVLDVAGHVLADIGGPYVIAPVAGDLRSDGRLIGSFVMSVQDDVGFTKLESREIGDPIGLYIDGRLVVQRGGSFPLRAPTGASVTLHAIRYSALALTYNAFPAGTLSAVIALPPPAASVTAESCSAVTVGEVGRVAERIAARFHPLDASYAGFVETVHSDTGAIVVVRIGLRPIAGSEGIGPPTLPLSGTVTYLGETWSVFSFAPTPPARIYLLIAPA